MKPFRFYSKSGREMFAYRPGQLIPAGAMVQVGGAFKTLETQHVTFLKSESGNPWEQGARDEKHLEIKPLGN